MININKQSFFIDAFPIWLFLDSIAIGLVFLLTFTYELRFSLLLGQSRHFKVFEDIPKSILLLNATFWIPIIFIVLHTLKKTIGEKVIKSYCFWPYSMRLIHNLMIGYSLIAFIMMIFIMVSVNYSTRIEKWIEVNDFREIAGDAALGSMVAGLIFELLMHYLYSPNVKIENNLKGKID